MKEIESNQVKLLRKAWVKFGHFYKGTNDVFFIGWMEMNRGWSWRVLTGTNLEHIIRILSNSTQKELTIAQMLLRKLARGAVKYHLAWMNHGIGIHWKAILSSWRWMLQGISNCIFYHRFPKTSHEFVWWCHYFFHLLCAHSWQHLVDWLGWRKTKLRLLWLDILEHPHSLYVTLGHSQSQTIRECNSFLWGQQPNKMSWFLQNYIAWCQLWILPVLCTTEVGEQEAHSQYFKPFQISVVMIVLWLPTK